MEEKDPPKEGLEEEGLEEGERTGCWEKGEGERAPPPPPPENFPELMLLPGELGPQLKGEESEGKGGEFMPNVKKEGREGKGGKNKRNTERDTEKRGKR